MLIELATDLANRGFNVFPCLENSKVPAVTRWNEVATKDQEVLNDWFSSNSNLAIHTDTYNDYNLVVLDIDVKGNRNGFETLSRMNVVLPETFSVKTPSGGMHYYYITKEHVKNGVNAIGPGIDVRAANGYVLAPGSSIDGKKYEITKDLPLAVLTENILSRLGKEKEIVNSYEEQPGQINQSHARLRFETYLKNNTATEVAEGERSTTAYKRAAVARDYGLNEDETFHLMEEHFHTSPPMSFNEMLKCVKDAYKYAKGIKGADASEKTFSAITLAPEETFLDRLNKKYAIIFYGSQHVYLDKVIDPKTNRITKYRIHNEQSFKRLLSNQLVATDGGKQVSVFSKWVSWAGRKEYQGIVFDPSETCPKDVFNTWTGFDQEIKDPKKFDAFEKYAVNAFITHLKDNISDGDENFYNWITTYLANIIQNPGVKHPNCAILQGAKGTGKSILMDIMSQVIGEKYVVTLNNMDEILGNFNAVIDEKLLINLDEAYWAANKAWDAPLKNVVSSKKLTLKAKFLPTREIPWFGRIISTTNEELAINATSDERRYSIKRVNDKARYNRPFFEKLAEVCLKPKGANAIFNYLRTWDLSRADIRYACETKELANQKLLNLDPVHDAWRMFLTTQELGNLKWVDGSYISMKELAVEIQDYIRKHHPKQYKMINPIGIGMKINLVCPSSSSAVKRLHGSLQRARLIPTLEIARKEFTQAMGETELDWGDEEIDNGMDLL